MPGNRKSGGGGGKQNPPQNDFKFEFAPNSNANEKQPKDTKDKSFTISKEAQAALMPVLQSKLNNLIGASSGYFESLPPQVQNRVKALKNIQAKTSALDLECKKELEAVHLKYYNLRVPHYDRRNEIVNGSSEPVAEELVEEVKEGEEKKEEKKEEKEAAKVDAKVPAEDVKGVPNFWLEALKHHDEIGDLITEADEEALQYLTNITYSKPIGTFELEFHFKENPYFAEKVLKKSYFLFDDPQVGEMFDHAEATEISWKPGMNLRKKLVTKTEKPKGRKGGKGGKGGRGGGGPVKQYTVEEDVPSFFDFFEVPVLPEDMEEQGEDEDDDSPADQLQAMLEEDFEIGVMIRDQIVANAVNWFTGEVPRIQYSDEFEDSEDETGDLDEELNSEDDEDFDLKKHAPQAKQGDKQECKQQ